MKNNPIITLLTDFGDRDGFVGMMKGVILSINPNARIVDIAHHVSPGDITSAAFLLKQSVSCFPNDTIHVVVVDPGVGSSRRAVCVKSEMGLFVAPDNGVLNFVISENCSAVNLQNEQYFKNPVSHTFHGRDVLAPVAAHLSLGVKMEQFGPEIKLDNTFISPKQIDTKTVHGEIIYSDRFGNLVTNIKEQENIESISLMGKTIKKIVTSYASVDRGEFLAIWASHGYLEISVRDGSARELLGVNIGDSVEIKIS